VSRVTRVANQESLRSFRVRSYHALWRTVPSPSANLEIGNSPAFARLTPTTPPINRRFRLFPFRSPLLRESHCFLFLQVLRWFTSLGSLYLAYVFSEESYGTPYGVPSFGNPRITACLRLPEAYRSLPRPSSPMRAKASTRRP
jgi:hypothetical protein